jgi:hypothetical protein
MFQCHRIKRRVARVWAKHMVIGGGFPALERDKFDELHRWWWELWSQGVFVRISLRNEHLVERSRGQSRGEHNHAGREREHERQERSHWELRSALRSGCTSFLCGALATHKGNRYGAKQFGYSAQFHFLVTLSVQGAYPNAIGMLRANSGVPNNAPTKGNTNARHFLFHIAHKPPAMIG